MSRPSHPIKGALILCLALLAPSAPQAGSFDLVVEGGEPAGDYLPGHKARAWVVRSSLWHGPRVAFCAEPGAPLSTGTHAYTWAGDGVSPEVSSMLATIDALPRNYAQRVVHLALQGERPTWLEPGRPMRTWLFTSRQYQDLLVVDRIPTPGVVYANMPTPYASDELFLAYLPHEVRTYLSPSASSGPSHEGSAGPHTVPVPGTLALLLAGLGLITWRKMT